MVAVPDTPLDRVLLDHLQRRGVPCVAGSEDDVLARFCLARKADAGRVVRVCADNPYLGGAVDRLVDFYDQGGWDYAYNHIPRNNQWPDGLGADTFARAAGRAGRQGHANLTARALPQLHLGQCRQL